MNEHSMHSHERWEELAAAQALHALEPPEEFELRQHIEGCAACRSALDDFSLVAAQLGSLADDGSPPPQWADVRARILSAARDDRRGKVPALRLLLRQRVLAVAAALALLIAAGVTSWQFTKNGQPATTSALDTCRQQTGCRVVQLHGQHGDDAAVAVAGGRAVLVPLKLPTAPSGRMYVLWQMPRDGSPVAIASLAGAGRQTASVPLATDYQDTAAFAVSLEPSGALPSRPTDVLAVGATPA